MSGMLLVAGAMLFASLGVATAVSARWVNRVELYRWITNKERGATAADALLAAPQRIVGTGMGLAAASFVVLGVGLRQVFMDAPPNILVLIVILVAIPSSLSLSVGIARALARRRPESVVAVLVPWLRRFSPIFAPFESESTEVIAEEVLPDPVPDREDISENEGRSLVSGFLAFTDRPVREVMTPRTEVVAVREGTGAEDIARVVSDAGFSRVPVYRESLDQIIGMIYAFDLLKLSPGTELPVRPVTVAPESRPCADLLFEMQRERRQLAVILDEYGGTAGIAALEDLLEELVEEIFGQAEEHSDGRQAVELIEVRGTTLSSEVADRFDVSLGGRAETVSGLLASAGGRIPRTGERFVLAGLEFDVLEATGTRVERVVVRRGRAPSTELSIEPRG